MTAQHKPCRDCGAVLPLSAFYQHAKMADGHLNKCKGCVAQRVRLRRARNESVREYDRRRANLPHRVEQRKRIVKQFRERSPDAYRAQTAVNNALRDGRLSKGPCHFCEAAGRVHAHHTDYSKPLDVVWLCVRCHRRLHALLPHGKEAHA